MIFFLFLHENIRCGAYEAPCQGAFNECPQYMFVCLFVLRFYGPVNPIGSCRARPVYLTTRLLVSLSPLNG